MTPEREPTVFVLDADAGVCAQIAGWLDGARLYARTCATVEEFRAACSPETRGCVLLGNICPADSGLDYYETAAARQVELPVIQIVEHGAVTEAVGALRRGAVDALDKPLDGSVLLASVRLALDAARHRTHQAAHQGELARRLARLSLREREIMEWVVAGRSSKEVASQLGISRRTADFHRANILRKMQAESVPQLAHMILASNRSRDTRPASSGAAPTLSEAPRLLRASAG